MAACKRAPTLFTRSSTNSFPPTTTTAAARTTAFAAPSFHAASTLDSSRRHQPARESCITPTTQHWTYASLCTASLFCTTPLALRPAISFSNVGVSSSDHATSITTAPQSTALLCCSSDYRAKSPSAATTATAAAAAAAAPLVPHPPLRMGRCCPSHVAFSNTFPRPTAPTRGDVGPGRYKSCAAASQPPASCCGCGGARAAAVPQTFGGCSGLPATRVRDSCA